MLDYTRIRELHPNVSPFDKWLDDVLNDQKLPPNVTLVRNLSAPSHTVRFDADRMRQVVINLIDNAAQAVTPSDDASGEHRIVIATAAHIDIFELVIADNGPGIPADKQQIIFEEFVRLQADDHPQREERGLGLGLAIVDRIARMPDLPIGLASARGRRSTSVRPAS